MDMNKVNDWLQIVATFAVFASLLFVGYEMRQTQQIAMSQAYQSRAFAVVDYSMSYAANPLALSAVRKAREGRMTDIIPEEYDAARRIKIAVFMLFDNAHYQYEQGFVDDDFWSMTYNSLLSALKDPITKEVFMDRVKIGVRPSFEKLILEAIKINQNAQEMPLKDTSETEP